ncbi:putative quinol monooxygenase [Psychrobacter sp. JCM 18900]|uniref:putative quinol monooxygenase n=1 Tax=Psychrobacter sp. JCM 18900 TaxID=1298608 RepID=UPI0039B78BF1
MLISWPNQIETVKTELIKLIGVTRTKKVCINYDLHQDNKNPAHFIFYENWASYTQYYA